MNWKEEGWKLLLALTVAAALCYTALLPTFMSSSPEETQGEVPPAQQEERKTSTDLSPYTVTEQDTQPVFQPEPGPEVLEETPPTPEEPEIILPTYDFTLPAPQSPAVDKSYFHDAAFVGDSRTDGFMIYSGIGTGKNLTSNGLSIFKLETKKALTIGGEKYTLVEALALQEYGKVYLSLGINELGVYDDEGFYQAYLSAIDAIRAVQPHAVIYIQGLIPLNEADIAAVNGPFYLKNDRLVVYNDLMRKAAQEKQVVFLDLYAAFADETGSLPSGASRDGVHLKTEYCKKWLEYLTTHTVAPEALGLPVTEEST